MTEKHKTGGKVGISIVIVTQKKITRLVDALHKLLRLKKLRFLCRFLTFKMRTKYRRKWYILDLNWTVQTEPESSNRSLYNLFCSHLRNGHSILFSEDINLHLCQNNILTFSSILLLIEVPTMKSVYSPMDKMLKQEQNHLGTQLYKKRRNKKIMVK